MKYLLSISKIVKFSSKIYLKLRLMNKFKTLLIFLFLAISGLYLYASQSTMIYLQPKINLYSPLTLPEVAKNIPALQCFKQQEKVKKISQSEFKILVWNMHKGADKGWQQALSQYARQSDFVLLQEVSQAIEKETSLPALFSTRLYISSFSYRGKDSGVGFLSRFNPQSYCVGQGTEPWIRIPKVGLALTFPLKNQASLLIINLHLVNFELNPTYYKKQLSDMLKLIKQHQGPVILAGDFNAWSKKRYHLLQKLSEEYALKEVSFSPDYRLRFLKNPLDFVFVRGLTVLSARTEQTQSSDHNPLLLHFAFEKN